MCKEQKDFGKLLEEIGATEIKSCVSKQVDIEIPVKMLMRQFQDLEKEERQKLLEDCQILHEDYTSKVGFFEARAALVVSVIVAFISALAIIIAMANSVGVADILCGISIGVLILSTLIFVASICALIKSNKMSKIADRYRNASLALTILQDGN